MTKHEICLVGGSGFIGTSLCRRLIGHREVRIVDKVVSTRFPELTKIADVRDPDSLRATIGQGSILVNLAAEHRDDVRPRSLYDEVNVGGARNLCRVAEEKEIDTVVFTSSVAVYGFAPPGTDESGAIDPFNDYGRTKYEAEQVFLEWQRRQPRRRTLVIVRPTVVFGEGNRGNVYNLFRQIASRRFVMVGRGKNRKSMAYVENIAAFLVKCLDLEPGVHLYNYVDKPDFDMNSLVALVRKHTGRAGPIRLRLPTWLALGIGKGFDVVSYITKKNLPISFIRVRKFTRDTVFDSSITSDFFVPPVSLETAVEKTVAYEFPPKPKAKAR